MDVNVTMQLHPAVDAVLTAAGTVFFCIPAWVILNAAARLSESDRQSRRATK